MNILTGTNPRGFSAIIPSTILETGTNPRGFSANLKVGTLIKIKTATNASGFSAQLYPGIGFTFKTGTNPRKFSMKLNGGFLIKTGTNARSFSMVLAGVPELALKTGTNPRKVQILMALPQNEAFTVLVLNLMNKLPSFYENYNFNSACPFNNGYLAIGPAGIYTLTGDSDSGAPINASILTGDSNYGTDRIKTDPEIFLNYSGGEMQVSVYVDESDQIGPFQVPQPEGNRTQTRRARLPKGLRGSRLQYLIENVNGDSSNFQSADLGMNVSQRRIH